ncbi:unnamed protein product [Staurois parvus]|uniref:C2H2-type domain-containing protein n=1 Tax=Staurois parvus TaxID=386267 RepID=A0ABN9BQI2_9NEOB|nr:unnamed protein product [Staurois parvus]
MFSEKSNLYTHSEISHREKPYSCPSAGRIFFNKDPSVHTSEISHTAEKPYSSFMSVEMFFY